MGQDKLNEITKSDLLEFMKVHDATMQEAMSSLCIEQAAGRKDLEDAKETLRLASKAIKAQAEATSGTVQWMQEELTITRKEFLAANWKLILVFCSVLTICFGGIMFVLKYNT